jgi:hypothetical protein
MKINKAFYESLKSTSSPNRLGIMKRSLPIEEPNRLPQLGCAAGGMQPIRPNEHVYELREPLANGTPSEDNTTPSRSWAWATATYSITVASRLTSASGLFMKLDRRYLSLAASPGTGPANAPWNPASVRMFSAKEAPSPLTADQARLVSRSSGVSGRISPLSRSSSHRSPGISVCRYSMLVRTSAAERAPGMTAVTAGWLNGN